MQILKSLNQIKYQPTTTTATTTTSSFSCFHSGVATADVFQTSAQKIWQCFTLDALPDANYY